MWPNPLETLSANPTERTNTKKNSLGFGKNLGFFAKQMTAKSCELFSQIALNAWKVSIFGGFLVHIFPHLDWIGRDKEYLSMFSPNTGKNGREKLRIRTLFTNSSIKDVKQGSKYADVITLNSSIFLVCFFLSKNPYLYHFVSI